MYPQNRITDRPPAAGLAGLGEALEATAPAHVEATDARGAVRVRLGHDGLPESIEVNQDWEHRLRHGSLAQALMEACRTAAEQRTIVWAQRMADPCWQERMDQVVEFDPAAVTAQPSHATAFDRNDAPRRPRSVVINEILEAVDSALADPMHSDAHPASAGEPVHGEGSVANGRLLITLSAAAAVSCTADPGWVSQRSPEELTEALGTVLAAARADLARAMAAGPAGRLERLLRELGRDQ
jgi:hypothetical protein